MIRTARLEDIPTIEKLLYQVHDIHATIRPDLFIKGKKKYSSKQLEMLITNGENPIFLYDDSGIKGYAFCYIQQSNSESQVPHKSIYIDDLCVDKEFRGKGVGKTLFDHVCQFAKEIGCYNVTLNVWEGNDNAKKMYEHIGMRVQETKMEKIL